MSGVIDSNGVQWEHCNGCGEFVQFAPKNNLGYQKPSKSHPYGRMLCIKCVNALPQWHLARIIPAPAWKAVRG